MLIDMMAGHKTRRLLIPHHHVHESQVINPDVKKRASSKCRIKLPVLPGTLRGKPKITSGINHVPNHALFYQFLHLL